ncbi:BACON domain-containing carbohydrate-binding protein [Alistipes sp.]|uniref:BACON domain-containing protein n=1 Tax=Alistipes sp. TaxID=1872444 RepID=UPI00284636AF|nr:BACON domain-containing carbohydrate-binding protein [Alistipes sp.]MDR3785276.1 BACON domain-containing carbohydrate-binding protein [Alistipes sp.]
MSKHLFRLLFGAFFLVAATAFTGCSDDDDKSLTPKLTADPTALDFTDETATTQTVAITANCEWTVTASNLDWATISPMSGKGNGTISVTVSELPAGTNLREGKISFTLIHPEFGKWGQAESSVAVKQYGSGVTPPPPTGDAIYANDFDKEQAQKGSDNKFPFADAFEGWKNQTGTGADNVAYKTSGISVRSNSPSNDSHSKYKDDASGVNNMFFGTSGVFEIQKIALESTQKNLQLTFGSYRSIFEDKDNAFKTSEFHVYLSKDGENWAEITYDRPVGDDEHSNYGTWALATANFTLKQVPSELYIKFTSDLTSAHRIDDVKLFEGIGGTEVDLDNITPPVTETKTIAEVIAGSVGATYTTQGQVVAINGRSFLIQDNSGKILVYLGWKDNKPVVDYSATIGQTVKVTGKTTTYSKLVQFSETDLVIEKVSDGSFTQPTPEKFDGAAFDAYAAATPVIKYIEYSGTLTIDGYYYNIAVDGTDLQGSLAYPADGFVDASLNGQVVIVKGYTLGMTNQSKMLSTIAVSVEKDGDAPAEPKITKLDPTSLSFAATDNAKTVTVTAANADDCTIEAATDKSEQFTTSVKGMVVTVTPKENTTEQAITATLTIKLMKAGAAVDTKTVAISQAGKIVGSGYVRVTSITSGKKYLIVAENGDKYAVLPASAGLNASKLFDGIAITVANGKIEANAANNAHAVTIVASDGAYTIQNTAGKFIEYANNNSSGKTQLAIVDASSRKWVADEETAGTFLIKDSEVTGRALLYRNGDTEYDNRFGGYATSNIGKGYITVALYELSE